MKIFTGILGASVAALLTLASTSAAFAGSDLPVSGATIIIVDDVVLQGVPAAVPMPPNRNKRAHVAAKSVVLSAPAPLFAAPVITVAMRKPVPRIWLTTGDGF